jgi:hypothetical protein
MTQGGLAVSQLATEHKFTQSLVFKFSLAGFFIFYRTLENGSTSDAALASLRPCSRSLMRDLAARLLR